MTAKDLFTGIDNSTYDLGRVGVFMGIVFFCVLSAINCAKFDPQTFGVGFASILTGGGAMLYLKKDTEPPATKG